MSQTGSDTIRIAIIGAGPAGFYAADHLLKQTDPIIEVDMFDRLPSPYGLVRAGVAPDHQKIKNVTKAFDRIAAHPRFRFFGYVELGKHVQVEDLRNYYHQIVYTVGAESDRKLGIPGEDLTGNHTATEFVAWYNGHPFFQNSEFDLTQESVAVVGVGNVAMDVARILCKTPDELRETDIADHALEALAHSRVKEVFILGRRGPAQAAFTNPEIKELEHLSDTDVIVLPEEAELDDLSRAAAMESSTIMKKVEILQAYASQSPAGKSRRLTFRFLVSPTELFGDENGCVNRMRIVKNELYATEAGTLRPRPTDHFEEFPVGLVFRSIGYRGVPLPGVPFNDSWGVILNRQGRVINPETGEPKPGEYTAGWIKRGPSGVIGTNKPDAVETANWMLQDIAAGKTLQPRQATAAAAEAFIKQRQPRFITFADWKKIDAEELARGKAQGRPRIKITSIDEMLAVVGK